jgi:hypothetical protein
MARGVGEANIDAEGVADAVGSFSFLLQNVRRIQPSLWI